MQGTPWPTAADSLSRDYSQYPELRRALARLSTIQSHQARLADKIEAGRILGLQQDVLNKRLKRQLDRMTVPTQEMW